VARADSADEPAGTMERVLAIGDLPEREPPTPASNGLVDSYGLPELYLPYRRGVAAA
jgi:hypothetical protein